MHTRTIPAGGRLRRAVPNSSPIRKSVSAFGGGPGGGGAGESAISLEINCTRIEAANSSVRATKRVFAYTFREGSSEGRDFGYLVRGDGCCHDAEDFFWR